MARKIAVNVLDRILRSKVRILNTFRDTFFHSALTLLLRDFAFAPASKAPMKNFIISKILNFNFTLIYAYRTDNENFSSRRI